MKFNKFFMLGLAGLAFAACSNEEAVIDGMPEGNGAVSIKIVQPTTRTVTTGTTDNDLTVALKSVKVSLTAKFNGSTTETTKTIKLEDGGTEAKFWNVTDPKSVAVSINGGMDSYSAGILSMQSRNEIPAYGVASDFKFTGTVENGQADADSNSGAVAGDDKKSFYMYEATVTPVIPVARLEVSDIKHKAHTDAADDKCKYKTLTINGVYMDNILATGDATTRSDYKFPSDKGTTATGAAAILSDEIAAGDSGDENNFLDTSLSWPAADADGKAQVFAYNFYAPAADDQSATVDLNPHFKIYFADAAAADGGTETVLKPRYAKIISYKVNGQGAVLRAGCIYRITNVELEDKNIIGNETGEEQWGVTVTVEEAKWTIVDTEAEWAEGN